MNTRSMPLYDRVKAILLDAPAMRGGEKMTAAQIAGLQVSAAGEAVVSIEVDPADGAALEGWRQQIERRVRDVAGVTKASIILTAERAPRAAEADPHGMQKNPALVLPVRAIIAVASGKGGVGKSTVAANLAYVLARAGLKAGLLDADIYGPSQPKMMGLEGYKPAFTATQKIIPPQVSAGPYGLKVMSIGFMVEADKALIWRGPMVQSAIYQLFRDVEWAAAGDLLDVLIVDMPPGTGDAQLTLAQKIPVTGAIIVSTPQDMALIDARKAIEMFQKTNVPILGVVENMCTHICSKCGHEEHIFGHGGARKEAARLGVPFLGEIPLSFAIRENADAGRMSESAFEAVAGEILAALRKG